MSWFGVVFFPVSGFCTGDCGLMSDLTENVCSQQVFPGRSAGSLMNLGTGVLALRLICFNGPVQRINARFKPRRAPRVSPNFCGTTARRSTRTMKGPRFFPLPLHAVLFRSSAPRPRSDPGAGGPRRIHSADPRPRKKKGFKRRESPRRGPACRPCGNIRIRCHY